MKEEFIAKLAKEYSEGWGENDDEESFKDGFDAAIRLELPIRFAKYLQGHYVNFDTEKLWHPDQWREIGGTDLKSTLEVFQCWFNDIYTPSNK